MEHLQFSIDFFAPKPDRTSVPMLLLMLIWSQTCSTFCSIEHSTENEKTFSVRRAASKSSGHHYPIIGSFNMLLSSDHTRRYALAYSYLFNRSEPASHARTDGMALHKKPFFAARAWLPWLTRVKWGACVFRLLVTRGSYANWSNGHFLRVGIVEMVIGRWG